MSKTEARLKYDEARERINREYLDKMAQARHDLEAAEAEAVETYKRAWAPAKAKYDALDAEYRADYDNAMTRARLDFEAAVMAEGGDPSVRG